MQPSEFWALSTEEFWWEFDERYEQSRAIQTRKDGTSELDWDKARAKHKEKMNGRNRDSHSKI